MSLKLIASMCMSLCMWFCLSVSVLHYLIGGPPIWRRKIILHTKQGLCACAFSPTVCDKKWPLEFFRHFLVAKRHLMHVLLHLTRRRSWECISPPSKFLKTPRFLGKFVGVMSGLSLGTRMSNLESVALTVLELLAFNVQKFRGSRDRGHAPFWENFWGSCPDCPCEHVCQIWRP